VEQGGDLLFLMGEHVRWWRPGRAKLSGESASESETAGSFAPAKQR
jgi:hypothetical protein